MLLPLNQVSGVIHRMHACSMGHSQQRGIHAFGGFCSCSIASKIRTCTNFRILLISATTNKKLLIGSWYSSPACGACRVWLQHQTFFLYAGCSLSQACPSGNARIRGYHTTALVTSSALLGIAAVHGTDAADLTMQMGREMRSAGGCTCKFLRLC